MDNKLVIDEQFEGLQYDGVCYRYRGCIHCTGSLNVTIPLHVEGDIIVDNTIVAAKSLSAWGNIKAGDWIEAESLVAGGRINAGGHVMTELAIEVGQELEGDSTVAAGTWIKSNRAIYVRAGLSAGSWIKAVDEIVVDGDILAKERIETGSRIIASGVVRADIIKMGGVETKKLLIVQGLEYPILVMDNHIRIGCRLKTKQEWLEFAEKATETEARRLGDTTGEMWAMREYIIALAKC